MRRILNLVRAHRAAAWALAGIVISVLTHFRWFTGFGVLTDGDWPMRFPGEVLHMLTWPEAWQPNGYGQLFLSSAFYYMEFVHALLAKAGFGFNVIERVEYLWPIAVLTPLGAHLLIRRLTRSDVAAFVGSLAWTYNVYFFVKQQSHIYIMLASAFLPFALLAYLHCIRTRTPKSALLAALALFTVTATDFRIFYILAFVLAALALSDAWAERLWRSPRALLRAAAYAAVPVVLAMLMNAYWLVGLASTGSVSSNPILDRALFGNHLVNTADALALWRGDWTDGKPLTFGTHPVIWRYWWLPLAALAGLWTARRNRMAAFFALVAMAGVFLSKQADLPFTGAYPWLFEHFPGFKAFRESSKFFVLQALGYGVLVGYLADWLQRQSVRPRLRVAGLVLLCALPLLNAKPLITGEIGSIFSPVTQQPEYAAFVAHNRAQPEFYRYSTFPRCSVWTERGPAHPCIGGDSLMGERATVALGVSPAAAATDPLALLREPGMNGLLDRLAVRYVTVALPGRGNHDDTFSMMGMTHEAALAALDAQPYLRRVDIGTGDLAVYENDGYRPHAYVTAADDAFAEDENWQPAEERIVDISRREITVKGVTGDFHLHFAEQFHPGWMLADRMPGRLNGVRAASRPLLGVEHYQGIAEGNSFAVDVDAVCAAVPCRSNGDGSRDVTLYLYFAPQGWFDLGSVAAGLTLAGTLGGFGFLAVRDHRRKKEAHV